VLVGRMNLKPETVKPETGLIPAILVGGGAWCTPW
jgi:hypothetical protein